MANLATPTVVVDDDTIEILPNSLNYKSGFGDVTIRTQQAGQAVSTIVNQDGETQLSMVSFSMILTADADEKLDQWLEARTAGGVTIEFFDGSITKAFRAMVLTSEPDRQTGSEGVIELEFQGPPAT